MGLPVGPYIGWAAIASAFEDHPPDDQLVLIGSDAGEARVSGEYAWLRRPDERAGILDMEFRSGRIARLTVMVES